jgi:membrane protein implicated in regulation of membrane protease activity
MSSPILWVVIAGTFGVGEMITAGGFFLAPFAIASAVAAAAAAVAGSVAALVAFVMVSILTLAIVRPIVRSHLKVPPQIRTGAAALVGRRAVVLERIANDEGVGCVKIDGDVWTARSLYDDHVIEPGTVVDVVQIKGATALVSE